MGGISKDLTGAVFGRLTVIAEIGIENHKRMWKCRCSCGTIKALSTTKLNGGARSCGCIRREVRDITGERFGRLVARTLLGTDDKRKTWWLCDCDCGGTKEVQLGALHSGNVASCGCAKHQPHKRIDLVGRRFDMLVVDRWANSDEGIARWFCLCDCGKFSDPIPTSNLVNGHTTSCGCKRRRKRRVRAKEEGNVYGRLTVLRHERDAGAHVFWICRCECGTVRGGYRQNGLRSGKTRSCGCLQRERASEAARQIVRPRGKEHHLYRHDRTDADRQAWNRRPAGIVPWRHTVNAAAGYACELCDSADRIEAHHVLGVKEYPERALDLTNGVCLCFDCHRDFHTVYGIKHFDDEDWRDYCREVYRDTNGAPPPRSLVDRGRSWPDLPARPPQPARDCSLHSTRS